MSEVTAEVKFTYEQYCLLPEGDRCELIEGDFYMTPAPSEKHQRVCGNLHFHFRLFLRENPVGRVYIAPFDVILDTFSTVQPDLCFIAESRLIKLKPEGLRGAPDLAIEVLSPSTRSRDERLKKALYFKHGVRELWLVDPEDDSVYLYTREHNELELWRHLPSGSTAESLLLPKLKIELSEIFC